MKRAHPDLGRLGVFWHTQGSGKSYSMAFFAEKVRRVVPGNFTFLVMTDREDLDDQIWRTFIGCGVTDEKTPRAGSGKELQEILRGNHRFVFSLIHKFNQPVTEPYSERDDIIVISDEAHRTQAGKFARNMRLALPNASFIGFTGTPLFKHDELTRRIFGDYISRYDFKRSEEDQSTVKLVYENRGEKLGIARLDLNDRIAEAVEKADLDPDQTALLEKLLGKDYEVITADDRLDKLADDFVEHCSTRWETGKSMLVCIDKITCARMFQRIEPRWKAKLAKVKALIPVKEAELAAHDRPGRAGALGKELEYAARAGAVDGEHDHRDHHQRSAERGPRLPEVGLRHHPAPRGDEDRLPDARRQAGGRGGRLQGPAASVPHRHRLCHVADRLRRGVPGDALHRQADEGPHPDAGHRPRQPRLSRARTAASSSTTTACSRACARRWRSMPLGTRTKAADGGIVAPIEELVAALLQAIEAAENHLLGLGLRCRPGCAARPGSPGSKRCGMPWTRSTPRTRPSAGSRSWRGRCSSASRRC